MQYFLLDIPAVDQTVKIDGEEGHHLVKVKRCQMGETIQLFNGNGLQASAIIIQVNKNDAVLKISKLEKFEKPNVKTILLVVPPKGKNFPLLLEKAVEIGIDEIVPIQSERSIKEYIVEKEVKYEKILLEASKQCERAYLPRLMPLMSFAESLSQYHKPENLRLLFHTNSGGKHWELTNKLAKGSTCCIWIGPEGGWTENEIVFARSKNAHICTLPMPILRVETAVIAITSLIKTYLP